MRGGKHSTAQQCDGHISYHIPGHLPWTYVFHSKRHDNEFKRNDKCLRQAITTYSASF